jgi:competence protein ComEA
MLVFVRCFLVSVVLLVLGQAVMADEPKVFEKYEGCVLVATEWADGDSFLIRKATGDELSVRLYGVDCLEYHVKTDADAARLRTQRRYFGIMEAKATAKESIEMAKGFGKVAAEKTAGLLEKPFTVHTRMQRALGDGRFQRFYVFIELADGRDLGSALVDAGLARTYGVYADGPGERTREEYQESLSDLELQAAKLGRGIWGSTNWEKLVWERKEQRNEEKDDEIAKGEKGLAEGRKLNPNTAARDELMLLPKIGEVIANRIIEAADEKAFEKPEDLLRVRGISDKTLEVIVPYLEFE